MLRLFKVICVVCFLLVPLVALSAEEKALEEEDYFPAHYTCPDTIFSFPAFLYWISEEWKRSAPHEIGYPLLYSILIALPVIPFLCCMIPTKESLQRQVSFMSEQENERKRKQELERKQQQENEHVQSQEEDESESDDDDEEYYVPELEPASATDSGTTIRSKSVSSIGERLAAAVKVGLPELCAPRVVMKTSRDREEGEVTVPEQFPDLTTIDTADSFIRLKELGARICPESKLGKACVAVASGVLISYGIYRLFSK